MEKLNKALIKVQSELKAPKNQRNNFGKYNYRSAEDILEAVKPLLAKNGLSLTISDEVIGIGSLAFINATATVTDGLDVITASAQAGIDPNRKGMDIAQSFGSSSSYARKYALNGMFLIDDTKDADATNTHSKDSAPVAKPKLTKDVMLKMEKAIADGKGEMVKEALNKYQVTAAQRKELLG